MNTQTRQQQMAILRRRDLNDLRCKLIARKQRGRAQVDDPAIIAAIDAEIEALRSIGAGKYRHPALPDRKPRKRREQRAMPNEFRLVGGGLPGTGR